ncbi:MAG: hypothetical protein AB7E29_11770 [Xanthobacter sp.]
MKLDLKALAHLPRVDPAPFVDLISRVQGVQATRVNKAALSVVVEYDPNKISFPVWEKLLKADAAEVAQILKQHTA